LFSFLCGCGFDLHFVSSVFAEPMDVFTNEDQVMETALRQ